MRLLPTETLTIKSAVMHKAVFLRRVRNGPAPTRSPSYLAHLAYWADGVPAEALPPPTIFWGGRRPVR